MTVSEDTAVRYGHLLQVICDWVDTTVMVMVCGRGTAKSTVIQARRIRRCVLDMAGAPLAIVANTYANLGNNIMPAIEKGWQLTGWREGLHYVKGVRPPEQWRARQTVIVDDYRHAITFWNGTVLFLGSLDDPSLLAGKSVCHLFIDEAKFTREAKANRALPILRGDAISFGRSHLFLGLTITTDMPDISESEDDWYLRYFADTDAELTEYIVQAAAIRNSLLISMERERRRKNPSERTLRRMERELAYWDNGLLKMRKGATFCINTSSLVNIDILTPEYIERLYNGTLELHEFMKSVLGMRPGLRRDLRFYPAFAERHKMTGTASGVAAFTSAELLHLHADTPLEAGMDFGNMLSMVFGQQDGTRYYVVKNLYELPPGWMREMADQFLHFFAPHRRKELSLWYDRAGNNYQRQGQDQASQIKYAIEHDAQGRRTGWTVTLMSRRQATIAQNAEYNFMLEMMKGDTPGLPALLIDEVNCRELVSSLEKARAEIRYTGQVKTVYKIKRSEKLAPKKLPMQSTNLSDAMKYLLMRRQWLQLVRRADRNIADSAVEQWAAERKAMKR